jgi:hypothetical protein
MLDRSSNRAHFKWRPLLANYSLCCFLLLFLGTCRKTLWELFGNLRINHANNLEHFENAVRRPKSQKIEMV